MLNTEHVDQLRALIKVTNSFIERTDYLRCGLIQEDWEFKVMVYIVSLNTCLARTRFWVDKQTKYFEPGIS